MRLPCHRGLRRAFELAKNLSARSSSFSRLLPAPPTPHKYPRSLPRKPDSAAKPVSATLLAQADPRYLVRTQHPRSRIGRVFGLFHEIRGIHVRISRFRIQFLTLAKRLRRHPRAGHAIVLVVQQRIFLSVLRIDILPFLKD